MAIIFNEAGLADICPPCVVQSFVNHNARLFKIFIVGPRHFVVQRPSIRNCYAGSVYAFCCISEYAVCQCKIIASYYVF